MKVKLLSTIGRFGQDTVLFMVVLFIAYGLKRHYSSAVSDELVWILGPTSWLVEALTGIPFVLEKGAGFVSRQAMIAITKSCAGVNFLIIVFCMTTFSVLPKIKQLKSKLITLFCIGAGAYFATLIANTVRIMVAIYLYSNDIHFGWFSQARIHRIEGIAIYFVFLWLVYFYIQKYGDKKYAY